MWTWPLPECEMILHGFPHPGGFGTERKFDIHSGVDIYCQPEQEVISVEDGVVVFIEEFTGEFAEPPSPWWHNTKAVGVEGISGVVVYGEIQPHENIAVGKLLKEGERIGNVITVLKKYKGLPMTMLHIELHKIGTRKTVIWNLGEPKPESLIDPLTKLVSLK